MQAKAVRAPGSRGGLGGRGGRGVSGRGGLTGRGGRGSPGRGGLGGREDSSRGSRGSRGGRESSSRGARDSRGGRGSSSRGARGSRGGRGSCARGARGPRGRRASSSSSTTSALTPASRLASMRVARSARLRRVGSGGAMARRLRATASQCRTDRERTGAVFDCCECGWQGRRCDIATLCAQCLCCKASPLAAAVAPLHSRAVRHRIVRRCSLSGCKKSAGDRQQAWPPCTCAMRNARIVPATRAQATGGLRATESRAVHHTNARWISPAGARRCFARCGTQCHAPRPHSDATRAHEAASSRRATSRKKAGVVHARARLAKLGATVQASSVSNAAS